MCTDAVPYEVTALNSRFMFLFVCLHSYSSVYAFSVCLCVYTSPGQNYKESGFLLVLGKICMSKKRIKRINLQNNSQVGPEFSQDALHIKHIHFVLYGNWKFKPESNFCAEKELWSVFGPQFSLHQLPANCFGWRKASQNKLLQNQTIPSLWFCIW